MRKAMILALALSACAPQPPPTPASKPVPTMSDFDRRYKEAWATTNQRAADYRVCVLNGADFYAKHSKETADVAAVAAVAQCEDELGAMVAPIVTVGEPATERMQYFRASGTQLAIARIVFDRGSSPPPAKPVPTMTDFDRRYKQAEGATDVWTDCLIAQATRLAKGSNDAADVVAIAVKRVCESDLEQIIAPLRDLGQDTPEFRDKMSTTGSKIAITRILNVRAH